MPTVTELTTEARKPFYATVGLGQLAIEQARVIERQVQPELSKLQELAKGFPTNFADAQDRAKSFPTTVQTQVKTYQAKAEELYDELVERGEKLVGTIRRQPSAKVAEKDIKDTERHAKGTETLVKKTTKSVQAAAADAKTTVEKTTAPKA